MRNARLKGSSRSFPPNEKALPALLDPEKEKERLEAVEREKIKLHYERVRIKQVHKRTKEILEGKVK